MKTLKLGTQTGSFINHIHSASKEVKPAVGMKATILSWTDRRVYEVLEVTEKTCRIKRFNQDLDKTEKNLVLYRGNWCSKCQEIMFTKQILKDNDVFKHVHAEYVERGGTYNEHGFMNKVVDGLTRIKTTYYKEKIVFDLNDEYFDPHF